MSTGTRPNRGCGTRKQGGAYTCCGLSKDGLPLESFLIDPVQPINTKPFRGMQIINLPGSTVNHVLDWVGEEFYPTITDFLEEVRCMGVSRRIPVTFQFDKLTPGSRMIFVHRKARLRHHQPVTAVLEAMGITVECPKHIEGHAFTNSADPCIGLNWPLASLIKKGIVEEEGETLLSPDSSSIHRVCRKVGDTQYMVPDARQIGEPVEYEVGIFASFPITQLEYVKFDGNPQQDGETLDALTKSALPVKVCRS